MCYEVAFPGNESVYNEVNGRDLGMAYSAYRYLKLFLIKSTSDLKNQNNKNKNITVVGNNVWLTLPEYQLPSMLLQLVL